MFHPNHQFLNRTATQACCRVGGVHRAKTLHIYAPLPPLCAFKRRVLPQRTPRSSAHSSAPPLRPSPTRSLQLPLSPAPVAARGRSISHEPRRSGGRQRRQPRQRAGVLLRPSGARAGGAGAAGARRGAVPAVRGVRARGARRGAAGRRPPDPSLLLRQEGGPVHRHAVPSVSTSDPSSIPLARPSIPRPLHSLPSTIHYVLPMMHVMGSMQQ